MTGGSGIGTADPAAEVQTAAPEWAVDRAAEVVAALRRRGETLATAESLTGGLVGAALTAIPGASQVYRGGLITYATELKATLAGVAPAILAADGPVAATTAAELARGAARVCGASWGVATTGVAGPEEQDGHPVGQVYVAVASGVGDPLVRELSLTGDRRTIRRSTVGAALELLADQLRPAADAPG